MQRELAIQFAFDDQLIPNWEPARTEWIHLGRGPKSSPDERRQAEGDFAPKTKILCLRLGGISTEDRQVWTCATSFETRLSIKAGCGNRFWIGCAVCSTRQSLVLPSSCRFGHSL